MGGGEGENLLEIIDFHDYGEGGSALNSLIYLISRGFNNSNLIQASYDFRSQFDKCVN